MKHISILVPDGAYIGGIESARFAFSEANKFLAAKGRKPLFDIKLVARQWEMPVNDGIYKVHIDALLDGMERTDLVIIPAMSEHMLQNIESNREMIAWIVKQYGQGAEVASLCVGAFLLAATGLIAGRQCSTHWQAANAFNRLFPEVDLVSEKIITDENGIYSSAGGYSFMNLLLYLVEKYAGRDIAILCAKFFEIDLSRNSQAPFIIFNGQKDHDDDLIRKAQQYIEDNFQQRITVDQLAGMVSLGRRNFERRFKKATSNTVVQYIQRVKMEAAKKDFETSRKSISEVMYDVGYTDTKAFRTVFKKTTGLLPIDYRNKYNMEAVIW